MAFKKFTSTNNAQATIIGGISASGTSLILATGQGELFPNSFPFRGALEQYDSQARVVKREIIEVSNRSSDTLTITRAVETCPNSFNATSQLATAFAFNDGDTFSLTWTAGNDLDIKTEIVRLEADKLNADGELRTGLGNSKLLITDGTGNETELANGTSGQFLQHDNTRNTPPISTDFVFGDGSDGALIVTSGTTNLNLNQAYNYSSISISVGATLSSSASGNPLLLKCNGLTTISGEINLNGKNGGNLNGMFGKALVNIGTGGSAGNGGVGGKNSTGAGGTGGTGGSGYGGGGGGGAINTYKGGAGGNGGTPGGTGGAGISVVANGNVGGTSSGGGGASAGGGGTSGSGGNAYSNNGGAGTSAGFPGGGGAGGSLGNPGGSLVLYTLTFAGTGTITATGGNGGNGGTGGTGQGGAGGGGGGGAGGGGGGGAILLVGNDNIFAGTITKTGGSAGTLGGAGTGGSTVPTAGTGGTSGGEGNSSNSKFNSYIF